MRSEYNKTILPNGLTIITENFKYVRSISVGIWVKVGCRDESGHQNGIAHFLEHMLFKGTERRSAGDIAKSLESVGGYLNAFTAKEFTCFYAEILDEYLPKAIDVLADILCNSVISPKEIKKERDVILDEIDSVEDTPDDLVQEYFVEKLYPGNSLGYPILGQKDTILNINRSKLLNFYSENYLSSNTIIAAAGNVEHTKLVDACGKKFKLPNNSPLVNQSSPTKIGKGEYIINKSVNQTHICIGTVGLPYAHQQKYELLLLNTLLGVGMGSRLFQNIREKYGVAYSIYSFLDFFKDNGLLAVYLGTDKNKTQKALKLLDKEILRLKKQPILEKELNQVKSQLKGNLILSLESSARRMSRLAKMEIYLQKFQAIDQVIHEIQGVSLKSISNLSQDMFDEDQLLKVIFMPNSN
jgi:predicted Zn-dependent peptidase